MGLAQAGTMKLEDLQHSLSVLEAARAAGLHPQTISKAVRRGELAHFRILGNRIRIRLADLEAFVSRTYDLTTPNRGGGR